MSTPPPGSRPPTDYRRYRRQTERRLFMAVLAVLLLVGSGLIFLLYGGAGAIAGFICLLAGAGTLCLLWLLLTLIEHWVRD
jgi:hypothetical protein